MDREQLKMLPIRVMSVRETGTGRMFEVLVDGDYDGEWFASLPWRLNAGSGYVHLAGSPSSLLYKKFKERYLHHFVLPPKPGYFRTHLNGNRLDNRSCNIAYITRKEAMRKRSDRQRLENFKAFRTRLDNPRVEE